MVSLGEKLKIKGRNQRPACPLRMLLRRNLKKGVEKAVSAGEWSSWDCMGLAAQSWSQLSSR
jgi:hypothetical protein